MKMLYIAFCHGEIVLDKAYHIPEGDVIPFLVHPWQLVTRIEVENRTVQIVRLDVPLEDERYLMVPLRQSYEVLSSEDYKLAGKCAELLYWDANSKFCGCCGAPMRWHTSISKHCTNCGKELWPQLQPAIIVRIERNRGEEILMVHARNFRGSYHGLVAGFVETGETLEECVVREVREEVGVEIANVKYFGSQSWPYPCGLMIAFTAQYVSGEVRLQKSELSSGGWFRHDDMPEYPGTVSIAGRMVRDWLARFE